MTRYSTEASAPAVAPAGGTDTSRVDPAIATRRLPEHDPRRDAGHAEAVVSGSGGSGADTSRDAGGTRPVAPAGVAGAGGERVCAWCRGSIPVRARRDAVCCSTRCRQARHRFGRTVGRAPSTAGAGGVAPGQPLRLAYADPPYPGKAHLYRGHPDYAGEVDHAALIRRLSTYDGWALSTSAAALPAVLALCPRTVRVAAWHRGERPTASRWPLNAWEPVIFHGGRPADPAEHGQRVRRTDSLVHGVAPMTTLPGRVIGAKPATFCRWLFELLGAAPGDQLDDLFPGSGAVTRAWHAYTTDPAGDPSFQAPHDTSPSADASRVDAALQTRQLIERRTA
jgi:hypothetical protein